MAFPRRNNKRGRAPGARGEMEAPLSAFWFWGTPKEINGKKNPPALKARLNVCLIVRRRHYLNRNDAAVLERHGFRWVSDSRRNVGIVERIVEWVADDREPVRPVMMEGNSSAEIAAVTERSVRIRIRRVRIRVFVVDPGLDLISPSNARGFLVR